MTQKIYLFRHGETEWNVAGKMQGRMDSPLTARGGEQCLAHGRLIAQLDPVSCFWVSSAGRTRASADLISQTVAAPQHFTDALLERDCGSWAGKTPVQVQQQVPGEWAQLQADAFNYRPGGGENLPDLTKRFRQLLAAWPPPDRLGIVTHGVVSRAILGHFLGLSHEDIRAVKHPNALFYELTFVGEQVVVRHYMADASEDGSCFEHSGSPIEGICTQLPLSAVSGE